MGKNSKKTNKKIETKPTTQEKLKGHASSSEQQHTTTIVAKPNTLIVGNLSRNVDTGLLRNFFQGSGALYNAIKNIQVSTFDDGTCKGIAQIEFETSFAVEEACHLDGTMLLDKPVRLNFGHEQRAVSPDSSSFEKPPDFSDNTVLIRGFDAAYETFMLFLELEKHFRKCGNISNTHFPVDDATGASVGIAFIEFEDEFAVAKALELNQSDLGGFPLNVEQA